MENKLHTTAHIGELGKVGKTLEEIWFEIGGSCHLQCGYCFANSGGIDKGAANVTADRHLQMLDEFKALGGTHIGIVGAGEPFHPRNAPHLYQILDSAESYGIWTTVFTTADMLDAHTLDWLDSYKNLTLQVKCNSLKPEVQDAIVQSHGYTNRRQLALDEMIRRGWNDGSRLGIVTSILNENAEEMPDLLRYARKNNLLFDADTILPKGRGTTYHKCPDSQVRNVIEKLRNIDAAAFNNHWQAHGSYIASPPCTRYSKHLYIDKNGNAHPCVGSQEVQLGNIKTLRLAQIWDGDLMRIIRAHDYKGKCLTCANYREQRCHSCLGRACENLTNESLNDGVLTKGCLMYRRA